MRYFFTPMVTKLHTAVIIVQTGTPADASPNSVLSFLTEFLTDPFVIQSRWTRWTLKNLVLPFYAKQTVQKYARFFDKHERALTNTSQALAEKLEKSLDKTQVFSAMRYGEPSLTQIIKKLVTDQSISDLLVIPLFPQYSHTTTGSVIDCVTRTLRGLNTDKPFKIIKDFYSAPSFIDCLASHINSHLDKQTEHLFLSYHSLPLSYVRKGDPYVGQCVETTRLLKDKIRFPTEKISHVYQSKMGRQKWMGPFLSDELERMARQGIKKVAVAFPGFTMDCLETLGEVGDLASEYGNNIPDESVSGRFQKTPRCKADRRHATGAYMNIREDCGFCGRRRRWVFFGNGRKKKGMSVQLIPCLNNSDNWIKALKTLI